MSNTIAAAQWALLKMQNLYSIELGNEPNCTQTLTKIQASTDIKAIVFTNSDPIAMNTTWTAAADRASELYWQNSVCGNLSAASIISAGVYFGTSPMSIQALAATEGDANTYVKDYCSHNYPQSGSTANLTKLMSHSEIKTQIKPFAAEAAAAKAHGKPHIFGETNSGELF